MNQIKWKAEASRLPDTKGRPFHRKYRGLNPYTENGLNLQKNDPFTLRMDNRANYIIVGEQQFAISDPEFHNLMRASLPNKEHQ